MSSQLPDKLSELIALALDDLYKCKQDVRYKIDMEMFYHASKDRLCHVCLAGAVMAQSLQSPSYENRMPSYYGDAVERKLTALNWIRRGNIHTAFILLGREFPEGKIDKNCNITPYEMDPVQFHEDLLALSAELEYLGE